MKNQTWRADRDLGKKHLYLRDHKLRGHLRQTNAKGSSKNWLRIFLLKTVVQFIVAALVFGLRFNERSIKNAK